MPNPKVKLVLIALLSPIFVAAQAASPADALALEQQGKLPPAARAWKMVIERDPSDAAFAIFVMFLSKEQKCREAASAYTKALARNPNQLRVVTLDAALPDAPYQLGRTYQAQGKARDAEKELHKEQELHKKAKENLLDKISSSPPALNPWEAK